MRNPFNRPESAGVSFLPEDYVSRRAEARSNIIVLSLFGVVMFGVVSAFFVTNRAWLTVRAQQHTINTEYTQEAKKIEQLKALEEQKALMMDKAEITTALLERVPRSVLAAELVTRMPEELSLTKLKLASKRLTPEEPAEAKGGKKPAAVKTLSKKRSSKDAKDDKTDKPAKVAPPKIETTLTLTGVAGANNAITDYLSALSGCQLLEAVELSYIKEIKIGEKELREFEIVSRIRADADARSVVPPESLASGMGSGGMVTDAGEPAGKGE
jgi:Tfp pilus assembly protein PilN